MGETWVDVAAAADVVEGEVFAAPFPGASDGREVALYRVHGKLYATSNICTHAYARLSDGFLEDYEIECPIHVGRFEIRTGRPLGPPVSRALACFELREEAGRVLVKLP